MLGWFAVCAVMWSVAAAEAAPAGTGTVLGGFTADEYPVVVETSKSGKRITKMGAGLELSCTSGDQFAFPATTAEIKVSRTGKFKQSFDVSSRSGDGTAVDIKSALAGALNRARSRVTGTWALTLTFRDGAGAVLDTCASDTVRWRAKQ
jgi:hypothetical protein